MAKKLSFDKKTLRRVLRDVKSYRVALACSLLCAAGFVALSLIIPLLSGEAIDRIIGYGAVDEVLDCRDDDRQSQYECAQKRAQFRGIFQIGHGPIQNKGVEGQDTAEEDKENFAHGTVVTDAAFFFVIVTANTGAIHFFVIVAAGTAAVVVVMVVMMMAAGAALRLVIMTAVAVVFFVIDFAHYFFSSSAFGAFTLFSRLSWNQIFLAPEPLALRMNDTPKS